MARHIAASVVPFALVIGLASISLGQAADLNIEEATIQDINDAFDAGTLTSEELVQKYLLRIAAYDKSGPMLNSIITVNSNALAIARELDAERAESGPRSPLHGVPVLLKDAFDTFDMATTGGSLSLEGSVPPDDAFITRQLREAGAVILGKTNMHEFGQGVTTVSSLGGQTLNPYDTSRIPGGSSGGTAAAIAANLATVGTGTDAGGSVRIPASFSNLVGLKPTVGLTSRDGVVGGSPGRLVQGPITRSVADAALMLDFMAGYDPADPATAVSEGRIPDSYSASLEASGLSGARIGVLREFIETPIADPDVISLINVAIDDIVAMGGKVVDPVTIPSLPTLLDRLYRYTPVEYYMNRYLESLGPDAPVKSLQDIRASGRYHPLLDQWPFCCLRGDVLPNDDPEYLSLLRQRDKLRTALFDVMESQDLDVILFPTATRPPPVIGSPHLGTQIDIGLNTELASFSGFPAISVPAGFTPEGLPVGVELLGRPFSEPTLIRLAYSYEQATQHRQPPPSAPQLATPIRIAMSPRWMHTATDNDSDSEFDDLGDNAASKTTGTRAAVGETDLPNRNAVVRLVAKFELVPQVGDLLESARIRFFLEDIGGMPTGPVSLWHSVGDNRSEPQPSDYEDTTYVDTRLDLVQPTDSGLSYYELDVTDFVLTDYAADGDNPLIAFRLQVNESVFVEDDQSHRYRFTMPGAGTNPPELVLTFIPEPSTVVLSVISSLGLLTYCLRRKKPFRLGELPT